MTKLEKLRKEIDRLTKERDKAAKEAFGDAAKDLFRENPGLKSFSFTAYTDNFNDGDPCTFGAHTDYPEINGESSDEGTELLEPLRKKISKFLGSFTNDEYLSMFGDHIRVTVTPKRVKVESYYDHD